MTWQERLREAAYTPQDSERLTFDFVDLSRTRELKGTAFEFPDSNDTYVQRTGATGGRYPMRVYFSGPDCDLQADVFEAALALPGIGKLEHPRYGTRDVVPLGELLRRDPLVNETNQVIIEFTLWDTVGTAYPTIESDPASDLAAALEAYSAAAAQEFEDQLELDAPGALSSFQARYEGLLETTKGALDSVAAIKDETQRQFDTVYNSISQGLTVLAGDPLTLAFQTLILLDAPARAVGTFSARLDAYAALSQSLRGVEVSDSNDLANSDLFVTGSVAALTTATLSSEFGTRKEAITAAESLLGQLETVTTWRDTTYNDQGATDLGEAYRTLQDAVALAAGYLVRTSFSLAQERRIILTRNRTMVDLVAELYGEVDEQLDAFIAANDLSWAELLELPAGREIVYYA